MPGSMLAEQCCLVTTVLSDALITAAICLTEGWHRRVKVTADLQPSWYRNCHTGLAIPLAIHQHGVPQPAQKVTHSIKAVHNGFVVHYFSPEGPLSPTI